MAVLVQPHQLQAHLLLTLVVAAAVEIPHKAQAAQAEVRLGLEVAQPHPPLLILVVEEVVFMPVMDAAATAVLAS